MEEGVGTGWEWEPNFRGFISLNATVGQSESEEINGSLNKVRGVGGSMTEEYIEPGWRINDILLAAGILRKVQPSPIFSDEAEMRRVFGLVYDVLRCKPDEITFSIGNFNSTWGIYIYFSCFFFRQENI